MNTALDFLGGDFTSDGLPDGISVNDVFRGVTGAAILLDLDNADDSWANYDSLDFNLTLDDVPYHFSFALAVSSAVPRVTQGRLVDGEFVPGTETGDTATFAPRHVEGGTQYQASLRPNTNLSYIKLDYDYSVGTSSALSERWSVVQQTDNSAILESPTALTELQSVIGTNFGNFVVSWAQA